MPAHLGYVVAGYVLTAVVLASYALALRRRLRRARDRATAVASQGVGTAR